jgi:hypothetical protein
MIALNAHYDGQVLVPDEPLDLAANQKVRIHVEPITAAEPAAFPDPRAGKVDISRLRGSALVGPTNPDPRFPDDDSLWEATTANHLENGPNKPKRSYSTLQQSLRWQSKSQPLTGLNNKSTSLRAVMSTGNLTEALIIFLNRKPENFAKLWSNLLDAGFAFVPPDRAQAELAAEARVQFPLNFGDCFAYALAKTLNVPLLTLDHDF